MNSVEYFGEDGELDIFFNISSEDFNIEDEEERRIAEQRLDTMNALITANKDHKGVQLLLLCTNNTTKAVAEESGTTVYHIKKEVDQVKEYIKQAIA